MGWPGTQNLHLGSGTASARGRGISVGGGVDTMEEQLSLREDLVASDRNDLKIGN